MASIPFPQIQLEPVAVKAERDTVRANVLRKDVLELFCGYVAIAITKVNMTRVKDISQEFKPRRRVEDANEQRTRRNIGMQSSTRRQASSVVSRRCKNRPKKRAPPELDPQL